MTKSSNQDRMDKWAEAAAVAIFERFTAWQKEQAEKAATDARFVPGHPLYQEKCEPIVTEVKYMDDTPISCRLFNFNQDGCGLNDYLRVLNEEIANPSESGE